MFEYSSLTARSTFDEISFFTADTADDTDTETHEHSDACYEITKELICGKDEADDEFFDEEE